jgi:hypothetical protein
MPLFAPEGFGLILLALWIYAVFDCIATDESLVRNLPKGAWVMIVLFLPDIGSMAWLIMGRPMYAGWRPGDTTVRAAPRARGPEDSPGWSTSTPRQPSDRERLEAWEADLRRREGRLGTQASGTDPSATPDDAAKPPRGEQGDEGFPLRW